ncbi:MAG: hypothetical protein CVT48_02860 [Thermoplasmata archaeon HGW-Thermoplasmata-1]|nr:MAG: hypothetical protein CVT48_02860 [Thermoplasmata archaeon HGW-Thermoplasmata-1]
MRKTIFIAAILSFSLLSGCISYNPFSAQPEIIQYNNSVQIQSYVPIECSHSDRLNTDDVKFARTWLQSEDMSIEIGFKKYVDFVSSEGRMSTMAIAYIILNWNFSCKDGIFTTYWEIGEDGKDSIALGFANLDSRYFGVGQPVWLPETFIRHWDGEKWGEQETYGFSHMILPSDGRYYLTSQPNVSENNIRAFFMIESEKLIGASSLTVEFVEDATKTGWSLGNPTNFRSFCPLIFYNHPLWEEWNYNGSMTGNEMVYAFNFPVYADVECLVATLDYEQPIGFEDLDLLVIDANGTVIGKSCREAGESERLELHNLTGCAFGEWSIRVDATTPLVRPVEYKGEIRVEY